MSHRWVDITIIVFLQRKKMILSVYISTLQTANPSVYLKVFVIKVQQMNARGQHEQWLKKDGRKLVSGLKFLKKANGKKWDHFSSSSTLLHTTNKHTHLHIIFCLFPRLFIIFHYLFLSFSSYVPTFCQPFVHPNPKSKGENRPSVKLYILQSKLINA